MQAVIGMIAGDLQARGVNDVIIDASVGPGNLSEDVGPHREIASDPQRESGSRGGRTSAEIPMTWDP